MEHDKRLIIFIALSLAILLLFNYFLASKKHPEQKVDLTKPTEELANTKSSFSAEMDNQVEKIIPHTPKLVDYQVGEYAISCSTTGGYVSKIGLTKYKEDLLYADLFILPDFLDKEFSINRIPNGIEMTYSSNGVEVMKTISSVEPFILNVNIQVTGTKLSDIQLFSTQLDSGFYSRYQEFFYGNGQLSRIAYTKIKKTELISNPIILGARDRYYAAVLVKLPKTEYFLSKQDDTKQLSLKSNGDFNSLNISLFLGPQDITILKKYNIENILNFGLFNGIGIFLLKMLHFFHSVLKSWGLSIILISTLIYLLLFPLTAQSTKSIRKMQEIQPLVEDLRKKYKDNPQKLNKEVITLYKDYKVNPLGGCLPMFLQIPIFFTLYQVLIRSVEIKGAKFLWIKDLSKPDYLITFPASLPVIGNGLHILPIIMILIMFFQQKLTSPQAQSSEQQKMMAIFMPLIFGFIFYNFPAGLVLYWLCNSLFTFLYQLKIAKFKV